MADTRRKDLLPTAEHPAADDYLLLDGATEGIRKILVSRAIGLQFATVAALLADDALTYAAAQLYTVVEGDVIRSREEGFVWKVLASDASNHHVVTAGGVKLYVLPMADGALPLKAFAPQSAADLVLAIEAADADEAILDWSDMYIEIESQVSVSVNRLLWRCNGANISYSGEDDILYLFQISLSNNADHIIAGNGLEINGNGKVQRGIHFRQLTGNVTATFYAERLIARNIEMHTSSEAAAGIEIKGGFGKITLVNPEAHNISIRAGQAIRGVTAATGIRIANSGSGTGAYCLNLEIIRPKVRRVYSQDPSYAYDQDGIGIFAHPDIDTTYGYSFARVVGMDSEGCWGRDLKSQFARTEVLSPRIVINEGPNDGRLFPSLDFQTGPGLVIGGRYTIDGHECNEWGAIVRFAGSANGTPCAHTWVGGSVEIINGGGILTAMRHDADAAKHVISHTSGVTVHGTLREFAQARL